MKEKKLCFFDQILTEHRAKPQQTTAFHSKKLTGRIIQQRKQSNLWLRPPLLSDQFSKLPQVSKSNHYIWNLLYASTFVSDRDHFYS